MKRGDHAERRCGSVNRVTGLTVDTLRTGRADLSMREAEPDPPVQTRLRSPAGGRSGWISETRDWCRYLNAWSIWPLVASRNRRNAKHARERAGRGNDAGHPCNADTVAVLLKKQDHSLPGNRTAKESVPNSAAIPP